MNDRLLRAARGEPVDRTPVWFMRQAGRYLPEYRTVRERGTLWEILADPELAAQVTLQPLRRFPGLDAAIIFSDLMVVLRVMGLEVVFAPDDGPRVDNPVTSRRDVERLRPYERVEVLGEAIRIVRREVDVPIIGFGGGPFTLATYAVEGGPSRDHRATRALMHRDPAVWDALMARLVEATVAHGRVQVESGAHAIQIFDPWAGSLSPQDYREHVLPHTRRLFEGLRGVVTIHFTTGTAGFLELVRQAGGDVIGVDWRVGLDEAWRRVGCPIQGNLDPAALLAPREVLLGRVDDVLRRAAGRPGHIFNLGHGILPQTPPEHVAAVIQRVHGP